MYNYTIEHDEDMLYCELPTKRWKIRRIKTARDKKLRLLNKESRRLGEIIRNLGYEPLEQPIRSGYMRLFVLDEKTRYSQQADFYQTILDKINTVRYSPNKNFDKLSKKKRRGRRKVKPQLLQEPSNYTVHSVMKMTEDQLRMFYCVEYYDHQFRENRIRYIFSEPWRYVLSIRPYYITEKKRKDSLLEQMEAEIDDYLDQYRNRARLTKMSGRRNGWRKWLGEKERYQFNSIHNQPLHKILNEYKEEKEFQELWK